MKHRILSRAAVTSRTISDYAVTGQTAAEYPKDTEFLKADEKIKLSFLSLLVFLVALPSRYILHVVGELYLTELLLPLFAAGMILFGKSQVFREKIFWQFVVACFVMIMGYIVSDLVAGTDSLKYLRAWGRNFVLLTDVISLAIIFGSDRRLIWWFVLGMSSGILLNLVLSHTSLLNWKFGYGMQIIFLVILAGYFIPKKITVAIMVCLGVISIYLDSRSMGALCLVAAGIIFVRLKRPEGLKLSPSAFFRIAIAGALVMALIVSILNATKSEDSSRRELSDIGRFAALRISVEAIGDSPILGHGSWGEGTKKYAQQMYDETALDLTKNGDSNVQKGDVFRSHSQILQSWMEGGILAAIFFIFFGYQLIIYMKDIVLNRKLDYLTPLYTIIFLEAMWNLIMSPYGGSHRLPIAMSVAIMCMLSMEKKQSLQVR